MVLRIYKKYRLKRSAKLGLLFLIGIVVLIVGILSIINKPLSNFIIKSTREQVPLVEGSFGYKTWSMDMDLNFKVHLFHVSNPGAVMQGANPKLIDYGPYIYTEHSVKSVLEVNETMDEIKYSVARTYVFNKTLSGKWSEEDEVTMLNMAYIGAANMLVDSFPFMLGKLGNVIQLLFTNPESIFIQGKVKDILFDGLKLVCDPVKYPDMSMLCSTFKMKKSPLMKATETEGVYLYSLFDKINGSVEGPYTVNRGKQNISMLGFTTSLKNKRALRMWNTKECNTLIGTDSITWTPMDEKWPRLYAYSFDICRNMPVDYNDTLIIHGLEGWRYVTTDKLWERDEIQCYCPLKEKKPACLPKGLLDISKCQDAPIYASEPHFLHGDSMFLDFAQGLKPDASVHSSFIVVEPLTGGPLWGGKCIQFNMKLRPVQDIILLNNVSEGYFPLFWLCKSAMPERELFEEIILAHNLIKLMTIVQCVPFVIGLFIIVSSILLAGTKPSKKCTINPTSMRIPFSITSNATRRRMQLRNSEL